MNRILQSALLLAALAAAPAGFAQDTESERRSDPILPFDAHTETLENGLEVIVLDTGFPNLVSVQIPVQTGSRNEVEDGKSGFAHFFEHMMFRGTPNVSAAEYEATMTRAGARRNAYTTDDYTNYYATFAAEDLESVLRIEADRFQNLEYSVEDFKTEARAVLGEYNKNSANPIRKILEVQRDNAYALHPYKHTTMGFIEDIEDMPNEFDYSRTFFERWYRPEYTALIIAGDVDVDETMALVRQYWGNWNPPPAETLAIPEEAAPEGPVYANVEWPSDTLPYVTVGFHGPAVLPDPYEWAALNMIFELYFSETSALYKRLVEQEQVVDQFFTYAPARVDPYLATVFARVKDPAQATYVRDEILRTFALAREEQVDEARLDEAKSNLRYGFTRGLDNTGDIAAELASWVHLERDYDTINRVYGAYDTLAASDLHEVANAYFTDARMVVTTLAKDGLPEDIGELPAMAAMAPVAELVELDLLVQDNALPVINLKLLFEVGSAYDPPGKEGLSRLAASMITDAGSRAMAISEINAAMFPIAASFSAQVDKEMTTFTGIFAADTWETWADLALPMLLDPGYREADFERLRDAQLNQLTEDLRSNNEEWLSKVALQRQVFRGTPYAYPSVGTVEGIQAITLDDVRAFVTDAYARGRLRVGINGDVPDGLVDRLQLDLAALPETSGLEDSGVPVANAPRGREVEIIEKDTRATAITLGHPLDLIRGDEDFPALWLARTWLGEHRSAMSRLYQRIREVRGMNYGDYAYIESFDNGMFQFFPDPNNARKSQLFEIWIRPVEPGNAHMATRIALHELQQLIDNGLSEEDFENVRNYLSKNVFVMTSTQDQQLGYALDSNWYGIDGFADYMRAALADMTVEDVNAAIRRHFSADKLFISYVTEDAEGLKAQLVSDAFSPMSYDADKPQALLDEDQLIGAMPLDIDADSVTIVPVESVFRGRSD